MRIFVTGANGFVGRAFCRAAIARGHEVMGLCRQAGATLPEGCRCIRGDLENIPWHEVERFRPDALLHLAWIVRPKVAFNSPENEALVRLSRDLFERSIRLGIRHLSGTGTCIEYAPSHEPLSEDRSPLAPTFAYSRGKVAVAEMLETAAREAGAAWTWFRIFYCYGEGEHPDRLCPQLFQSLLAGERMVLQTPDSVKDYLHIDDVASALLLSLETGVTGAVNVGSGSGTSILQLAREIADIVKADPALVISTSPPAADPYPVMMADVSKLRRTGWAPAISLREGLERLHSTLLNQRTR